MPITSPRRRRTAMAVFAAWRGAEARRLTASDVDYINASRHLDADRRRDRTRCGGAAARQRHVEGFDVVDQSSPEHLLALPARSRRFSAFLRSATISRRRPSIWKTRRWKRRSIWCRKPRASARLTSRSQIPSFRGHQCFRDRSARGWLASVLEYLHRLPYSAMTCSLGRMLLAGQGFTRPRLNRQDSGCIDE